MLNMMNRIKVVTSIIFSTLIIISCSNNEDYYTPESVVEANAKYMNEEKYDEAMNTIHKDNPSYPASEIMIKQLFERYDLNYKIVSMKVLEDNKSTGIHRLKKDGDSWKIYSTQMTDIQSIN